MGRGTRYTVGVDGGGVAVVAAAAGGGGGGGGGEPVQAGPYPLAPPRTGV